MTSTMSILLQALKAEFGEKYVRKHTSFDGVIRSICVVKYDDANSRVSIDAWLASGTITFATIGRVPALEADITRTPSAEVVRMVKTALSQPSDSNAMDKLRGDATALKNSLVAKISGLSCGSVAPTVKIKLLNPDAVMPKYESAGAAGFDLTAVSWEFASAPSRDYIEKVYGKNAFGAHMNESLIIYKLGVAVEIPKGYVGLLIPRSSVATKTDLSLANSVGVIDSDYRGELMAVFRVHHAPINMGGEYCEPIYEHYRDDERVCQLVILPCPQVELKQVDELDSTPRGHGGFGSTGQ